MLPMLLVLPLASLGGVFECGWNRLLMLAALSVGASAAGLWFFAPTPVVLVFLAAGAVVLVATCAHAAIHLGLNVTGPVRNSVYYPGA